MFDRVFTEIFAQMAALIVRALTATLRFEVLPGARSPQEGIGNQSKPQIYVFWHNRNLIMAMVYRLGGGRRGGLNALISRHRDGRMIARAVQLLGVESVAGSSTRGSVGALRGLERALQEGRHVAIAPDGPKGPIYVAKSGAIGLASRTGCPIVPISYAFERYWEFRSWDRTILPKPFSRAVVGFGEPFFVPSELGEGELEKYTALMQERIDALTKSAVEYQYA